MQPPGTGGEGSLLASQLVGAGFAVPVDEGLIALQGLGPEMVAPATAGVKGRRSA
jgi:hypothetical protein